MTVCSSIKNSGETGMFRGNKFIRYMLLGLVICSIPGRTHCDPFTRSVTRILTLVVCIAVGSHYYQIKEREADELILADVHKVCERVNLDHGDLLDAFDQDSKIISQYTQKAELVTTLTHAIKSLSDQKDILSKRTVHINSWFFIRPDLKRLEKLDKAKNELQSLIDRMRKVLSSLKVSLLLQKA